MASLAALLTTTLPLEAATRMASHDSTRTHRKGPVGYKQSSEHKEKRLSQIRGKRHFPETMTPIGGGWMVSERVFWRRVHKTSTCWLWTGGRKRFGHGAVSIRTIDRRMQTGAHRVAWILANGPIPDGMCVCHHCDNPPCVNPAHLFIGTKSDNTQDAFDKGRIKVRPMDGARNPNAKLTGEQVREIRSRYPVESQCSLARAFGVSQTAIRNIVLGKRWPFVEVA